MIGAEFPGILPAYGLSFADGSGETVYFTINMSGKDGSLFLTEFQPAE